MLIVCCFSFVIVLDGGDFAYLVCFHLFNKLNLALPVTLNRMVMEKEIPHTVQNNVFL